MNFKDLTVGVLKEIMDGEKRVAATPETVGKLVAAGATVLVENAPGPRLAGASTAETATARIKYNLQIGGCP